MPCEDRYTANPGHMTTPLPKTASRKSHRIIVGFHKEFLPNKQTNIEQLLMTAGLRNYSCSMFPRLSGLITAIVKDADTTYVRDRLRLLAERQQFVKPYDDISDDMINYGV